MDKPTASFSKAVPEGDDRVRRVCDRCEFIDYENPRIVVGSVVSHDGRILMCRRAIEPRKGYWTLPAGYLETGETAAEGAQREAREEAMAELSITRLMAVYSIPRISQIQLMYEAVLTNPDTIGAGVESLEVALYDWEDIPWSELAFPSVHWALNAWKETRGTPDYTPFANPDGVDDMVR